MRDHQVRRQELYHLLGDLPKAAGMTSTLVAEEEREHYILETLVLDLNGIEPVPAYFVRPKGSTRPYPAVLFHHSHGGNYSLGKNELLQGNVYMFHEPYADALAKRGIASLCIDSWGFGERRGKSESELFKEMLWNGQVLWGMMVYDAMRAFEYAASRPDVDASRIGTLGMSMGSTMAWWLAALEPRVRVCADICCLTDFHALLASRGLDEHGVYYYVPRLLKHFTTAEINALIAPRPHLSLAGLYDTLTPVEGLTRVDTELKEAYAAMGAPEAWKLCTYHTGHVETAAMRKEVLEFLETWL